MGQKYAAYSSDPGLVTGYYDSVDSPPPSGTKTILLTNAEWLNAISYSQVAVISGALSFPGQAMVWQNNGWATLPVSLATQAAAAIAAGLTITLSGTMTLAATLFPTDPATTAKIIAVVLAINTDGTFPGGATTFPMKDSAGTWHTFTASQYKSVASALAAYVAALNLIIDGNPLNVTSLPANAITLTV